jgi:hypothetical protein
MRAARTPCACDSADALIALARMPAAVSRMTRSTSRMCVASPSCPGLSGPGDRESRYVVVREPYPHAAIGSGAGAVRLTVSLGALGGSRHAHPVATRRGATGRLVRKGSARAHVRLDPGARDEVRVGLVLAAVQRTFETGRSPTRRVEVAGTGRRRGLGCAHDAVDARRGRSWTDAGNSYKAHKQRQASRDDREEGPLRRQVKPSKRPSSRLERGDRGRKHSNLH